MVEGTVGSHHKEGSSKMSKHITICAGIDTGKYKLDVAIDGCVDQLQVDNTIDGHAALSAWLKRHRVSRIGIEASGGYEQNVVAHLRRDGFVVVVFQPAQVRAYARFLLQRAKNDQIDAALIAACTAAIKKIHAPPDSRLAPFAARMTLIEQLTDRVAAGRTIGRVIANPSFENSARRKLLGLTSCYGPSSKPWPQPSANTETWPNGST